MDERQERELRVRVRALADWLDVGPPGVEDVVRRGTRRRRTASVGTAGISVVLAAAVVLPLVSLLPIGDDAKPSDGGIPSAVLSPAPRECPIGISIHHRAGDSVSVEEFQRLTQGHLPTWLPEGFGLLEAFGGLRGADGLDAAGIWSDLQCREVLLSFNSSWVAGEPGTPYDPDVPQVGPWSLVADEAGDCGNAVLGEGRCLGYALSAPDGLILIQMMGIERDDGDRIALSIAGRRPGHPQVTLDDVERAREALAEVAARPSVTLDELREAEFRAWRTLVEYCSAKPSDPVCE